MNLSCDHLRQQRARSHLEHDLAAHVSGLTELVGIAGTSERKGTTDCRPQAARVGESTKIGKVAAFGSDHEKLRLLHCTEQARHRLHGIPKDNTGCRKGCDIASAR